MQRSVSRLPVLAATTRRAWSSDSITKHPAYNANVVESKWQEIWKKKQVSKIDNDFEPELESKFYVLSMFPYPSGRLHMGHVRVYTISDTLAHYHRMKGKKVLHPMGWDSFGLPAENAAIDRGVSPQEWTDKNVEVMRTQLNSLGCHFDWNREISTSSPNYYKWTQWLFLQLHKHGLAYKKKALVNWDPVDQTVLANEQVDAEGYSWRSGAKVEQKYLSQWFFRISAYAEDLLEGLKELNWSEEVKGLQSSWIGKSEGAYFDFKVQGQEDLSVRTFTTRPDTVYGVSFLAVSLNHELLDQPMLLDQSVKEQLEVIKSRKMLSSSRKVDEKKGINLGIFAVHPFTGHPIPIFAADYVITEYGTQAVMGVPGHDDRDEMFAMEHHLPITTVHESLNDGEEILKNSDKFSGMSTMEGAKAIVKHATENGFGDHMIQYRIRDWLVSRQRYWGTPIPIMYCEKCGVVPVPEDQLPVELPSSVHLSGRGPSPLAQAGSWLKTTCGKPGCSAQRETDTIDTFIDSSWYFLRYINPLEKSRPFTDDVRRWMPVDVYVGGIEHANLHLLYARFITHFLHNIGLLKTKEPFQKLLAQGMVMGKTFREKGSGRYLTVDEQNSLSRSKDGVVESWEKMSKSKYNGVDPHTVIEEYGADTVRIFMLFKAPPEMFIQWDIKAIKGAHRWLNRIWSLSQEHFIACGSRSRTEGNPDLGNKLVTVQHRTIKQVTQLLDRHRYNVAISELMIFYNALKDSKKDLLGTAVFHQGLQTLYTLLSPMAPHITSELWELLIEAGERLGLEKPRQAVLEEQWPLWSEEKLANELSTVVLQVNGMKKGTFMAPSEVCNPVNHNHLQCKAIQAAIEQNIIPDAESADKIYIGFKGEVVNFVLKEW